MVLWSESQFRFLIPLKYRKQKLVRYTLRNPFFSSLTPSSRGRQFIRVKDIAVETIFKYSIVHSYLEAGQSPSPLKDEMTSQSDALEGRRVRTILAHQIEWNIVSIACGAARN